MKTKMLALVSIALLSAALSSPAIVIVGDGDSNTNAPAVDGGCGWNSIAKLITKGGASTTTANVIGTNYVLTASHIVVTNGDIVRYMGTNHTVLATYVSNKLQVLKVSGAFPNGSWIPIYTNSSEFGKEFTTFGYGPSRGTMVTTLVWPTNQIWMTNFISTSASNKFDVVGGDIGTKFQIQKSTNMLDWITTSNIYILGANLRTNVSVPKGAEQSAFYRVSVVPVIITNGWRFGTMDGLLRWGKNTFLTNLDSGGLLQSTFDLNGSCGANESGTQGGDSGGDCAINDGGLWKIAAVNESAEFYEYKTQSGEKVYGSMCDKRGLTIGDFVNNTWSVTFRTDVPPMPTSSQYVRVSAYAKWLKQFAGK